MQVNRLMIERYHHIDSQVFEFEKGLNLLIAPNQKGKSTVLKALKIAIAGDKDVNASDIEARFLLTFTEPKQKISYKLQRILSLPEGALFADDMSINKHFESYSNDDFNDLALLTDSYYITHQDINQEQFKSFITEWQMVLIKVLMPNKLCNIDDYIVRLKNQSKQLYTKHAHSKSEIVKLEQSLFSHYNSREKIIAQNNHYQQLYQTYSILDSESTTMKQAINCLYQERQGLLCALPYADKKERLAVLDGIVRYEQISDKAEDSAYIKRQTISDRVLIDSQRIAEAETAKDDTQKMYISDLIKFASLSFGVSILLTIGYYFLFCNEYSIQLYGVVAIVLWLGIFSGLMYKKHIFYTQSLYDINCHLSSLREQLNAIQLEASQLDRKLFAVYQTTSLNEIATIIVSAKRDLSEYRQLKSELLDYNDALESSAQINAKLEQNNFDILSRERSYATLQTQLMELKSALDTVPSDDLIQIQLDISALESTLKIKKEKLLLTQSMLKVFTRVKSIYSVGETPEFIRELKMVIAELSDNELNDITLAENGSLLLKNCNGDCVSIEKLSTGAFNLLLFAQKIALLNYFDTTHCLPLLIDDAFISLDETRKIKVHAYLQDIAIRRQVIYATTEFCQLFEKTKNINIITL